MFYRLYPRRYHSRWESFFNGMAYSELAAAILIVGVLGFAIDLLARTAFTDRAHRAA